MKQLEEKLNKEYKNIGEITISSMHKDNINIKDIKYIQSIIDIIDPLDSSEPIIVSKSYNGYELIDGYHRLKSKIKKGDINIDVVVLDEYSIKRKSDNLLEFFEGLVGETIKFVNDETFSINGKYYMIECNEGCGGCSSGWSSIEVLPEFINKSIKIGTIVDKGDDGDLYDLYINGIMIAKVDTGWGNGYYGGDFGIKYIN